MKVTFIPIVIDALCSHRRTCKRTRRLRNKKTSGDHPNCWDRSEYWKEFWRLEETCCLSNSRDKPSSYAGVKNSKRSKIIIVIIIIKENLLNTKVTVIPIVIGELGSVTNGLVQGLENLEIRGQVETIPTTALLRPARILRKVQETWGDLLSLKLQWETIG